jgi:4-amino-4-deoxy-L-arabinose transferase-like glycosyltransferase
VVAIALGAVHVWLTVLNVDAARFSFDSAEYALAGRAWLETGRLVTPFVHPAALGASPGPPYPLIVGHPLVPALDAIAFALFGKDATVTLLPALLAYVATVLLTARLAWSLTRSDAATLAAGLMFACSPWALRFASEGLSEMPFTALFTAALWLLADLPERPRPVLLGVLLGLAHLTRPVLVPLLPVLLPAIVVLAPRTARIPTLARVLVAFVPLAALTALYKQFAAGGALHDVGGYLLLTGTSPEHVVARLNRMAPPPDGLEWLRAHPDLFAAKVVRGVRSLLYAAWVQSGRLTGIMATLAVLHALVRREPRARAFALTITGLTALLTLLAAATVADPRMLFPLLPVGIALATTGLLWAGGVASRGRHAVTVALLACVVAVNAGFLAFDWLESSTTRRLRTTYHEREWRGIGRGVDAMLPPDGLVASDAAPWVAWFARRSVTLVPLSPEALVNGPERLRPAAVVLTNEWLIDRPGEAAWRALFDSREPPPGFGFAGHVRSGRLEAVVFVRDGLPRH